MENTNNNGIAPEKKFSTGAISATIWKNQGQGQDGTIRDFRTVSLQRRYKDKAGDWQTASSMRINDLPKASLVLQKAYEYIVFKEYNTIESEEVA